ncbi:MAG: ketopantoate reductase family protein, partial [Planctomycetota bacterium]
MRVLVQGPGAIGRLIAARFALAGIPTGLLDRDPERARFIGAEGLTLDEGRGDGARRVRMPVLCTEDAATGSSASPVEWDLLVVCVKAHDVAHAVATGRRRLTAPGRSGLSGVPGGL